jgi:hypothetical protein
MKKETAAVQKAAAVFPQREKKSNGHQQTQ